MTDNEERRSVLKLASCMDDLQGELDKLTDRLSKLEQAHNKNAEILERIAKQQNRMAGLFGDVESIKKWLGTVSYAAQAIFEVQSLREQSEQITEKALSKDK